jgi:gliding motility-associated-like protein
MYKFLLSLAVILLPLSLFSQSPDAIIGDVEIETGCIGDTPFYNINYIVWNFGDEEITDYCIEIWNEDYYQCFDSDLFGAYAIPPGEGQYFTTPYFEMGGPGSIFVMSVDGILNEIVTGNNNTTVFLPEIPECPIDCSNDTITITLPPDTIIQTQVDTVITQEYVYLTDTITEYITDTVVVNNYIYTTDTLFIDNYIYELDTLYLTEYITLIDTITEYIIQEIYIDCNTGLPCEEDPPGIECPDWITFYIPNTFTPNNDGWNDVWQMVYNLDCWVDVEFKIFNRWGVQIYHGFGDDFDSYPYWDGSINGGTSYASDGVYAYIFKARKKDKVEVLKKSGHITIFR